MLTALRSVGQGHLWFSPRLLAQVIKTNHQSPTQPEHLTERELAVLRHVGQGLSNKEIARRLQISHRTVEYHLSNILQKLHLVSRVEAALWWQTQNSATEQK